MVESEIPRITHASHTMGVELNENTGRIYDHCIVCYNCFCHSKEKLLTACDDISWVLNLSGN